MSRIGKQPIVMPEKVTAVLTDRVLTIKGPLGEISREFKNDIEIVIADKTITLTPRRKSLETNALWGTYASHITNMVAGVTEAYVKKVILEGIGFKSEVKGQDLHLALGFSHPVKLTIPKGVKVTAEKNLITVSGIDKEAVGSFAATTRSQKKPEPYKGKGMRYEGEVIRRKEGKKSV
ncbi:MAG: hypothetical protein RLZZ347_736 [Candidatus Parcubacteria bacterium]|jgi:large subunit ribosomal protein L6